LVARRGLFGPLEEAGRVTVVSRSAGAGKSSLARGWIAESGLGERAAWVSVARDNGTGTTNGADQRSPPPAPGFITKHHR
jgi:ATP/maltotriose-dependent transcriptional regulator MalT